MWSGKRNCWVRWRKLSFCEADESGGKSWCRTWRLHEKHWSKRIFQPILNLHRSTSCISPKHVDARVPFSAVLVFVAAFSGMNWTIFCVCHVTERCHRVKISLIPNTISSEFMILYKCLILSVRRSDFTRNDKIALRSHRSPPTTESWPNADSVVFHTVRLSEAVLANQALCCHVDASLGRPPYHS